MKSFILDTDIFIYEPECLFLFEENDLYVAPATLRELTEIKDRPGEAGYAARRAKRILSELWRDDDDLKGGVSLGDGLGTLRVATETDFSGFKPGMTKTKGDDYILAAAAYLAENAKPDEQVILVTDDIDMAFLASAIGVRTQHFRNKRDEEEERYTGRAEAAAAPDAFAALSAGSAVPAEDVLPDPMPNGFVTARANGKRVLCRVSADGKTVRQLNPSHAEEKKHPYGVTARNDGQRFLISALMDAELPLVIAMGPAGTAKTFLSLACGLQQTAEEQTYRGILITRANVEMDATYGYLPGTEEMGAPDAAEGRSHEQTEAGQEEAMEKRTDADRRDAEPVTGQDGEDYADAVGF